MTYLIRTEYEAKCLVTVILCVCELQFIFLFHLKPYSTRCPIVSESCRFSCQEARCPPICFLLNGNHNSVLKKRPLNPSLPLRRERYSTYLPRSLSPKDLTASQGLSHWMPSNKCAVHGLLVHSDSSTNVVISRPSAMVFELCSKGWTH